MGDKVRVRKKHGDHQLRSQNMLSGKDVALPRQLGCWLRSSHHLKVRNSSLVE